MRYPEIGESPIPNANIELNRLIIKMLKLEYSKLYKKIFKCVLIHAIFLKIVSYLLEKIFLFLKFFFRKKIKSGVSLFNYFRNKNFTRKKAWGLMKFVMSIIRTV